MRCLCEKIKRLKNSIYEICDYNVPYEITLKKVINKLEKAAPEIVRMDGAYPSPRNPHWLYDFP